MVAALKRVDCGEDLLAAFQEVVCGGDLLRLRPWYVLAPNLMTLQCD